VEVESDASDEVVGCFWNALNWASRVTERPNVAQNHVAVTTVTPQKIPAKNFIHARTRDSGALQSFQRFS
jgi:hypothetical protein